jgi:hypothetical protein
MSADPSGCCGLPANLQLTANFDRCLSSGDGDYRSLTWRVKADKLAN